MYAFNNEVMEVGQYGAAAEVGPELSEALGRVRRAARPPWPTTRSARQCRPREVEHDEDRAAGENPLVRGRRPIGWSGKSEQSEGCFACLPTGEDVEGVKVFTIAYGPDADATLLKTIAERTNGKTFKGAPATIDQVYLWISAGAVRRRGNSQHPSKADDLRVKV